MSFSYYSNSTIALLFEYRSFVLVICSAKHELWFNHYSLSVADSSLIIFDNKISFLSFVPYKLATKTGMPIPEIYGFSLILHFPRSHLTCTDFHLTILNWASIG
jgi:hypothetical protein